MLTNEQRLKAFSLKEMKVSVKEIARRLEVTPRAIRQLFQGHTKEDLNKKGGTVRRNMKDGNMKALDNFLLKWMEVVRRWGKLPVTGPLLQERALMYASPLSGSKYLCTQPPPSLVGFFFWCCTFFFKYVNISEVLWRPFSLQKSPKYSPLC